jgi:5-methylcytosine-specific restriction protein A
MARTHGHGNPDWARDEVILALDLYFDCRDKIPGPSDPRVEVLSKLLRAFPHHSVAARRDSFRNPDGVAFKLQNLRQVATGKGLGNVSRTDRQVWTEFGSDPKRTKALANLIRSGLNEFAGDEASQDEFEFAEGRIVTELHLRRERDPRLRARLLAARRKSSTLCCDMCRHAPRAANAALSEAEFEAHHMVPLASAGPRTTRLSDVVLLCANCHRLLHRAIALEKRWLNLAEGRSLCGLPTK